MIHNLNPYPAMKDSDLPWLGKVPEHWAIKRGKNLFHCVDVRTETGKEELLTVSSERGIIPRRSTTVTMFKAESYIGHKLCWPGDLVINSLWAWSRGLGVSRHHGIVSTAYGVYRPRTGLDVDPRFIHELVRSKPFHWELQVRSKGVWTSRLQLTDDSFLGAPFPLPPLPEQAAIVRFLDHADRRIRKYIRAKQKLIKLLEEQKQAIIHHAITRGLVPNVRLKPSGVEWLGDVPEHWEVRKVGAVSTRVTKGTTPTTLGRGFTDAGIRFVKVESISKDRTLIAALCAHIDADTDALLARSRLRVGDVLVAIAGAIGRVAVVFEEDLPANCNQAVAIVTPIMAYVLSDWLAFVLASPACQRFLTDSSVQSAQANLSLADLRGTMISLPPMPEQGRIVGKLVETTAAIARAAASAQREISLLHEYRTRLIADVVTGKLDVREVAANLPEETEEPEALDEIEAIENGEEMMSEGDGSSDIQEAEA